MSLPTATPDIYPTLAAMITPAIFLTANGSLIISTSNRMSRIVDRIRALNEAGDTLCRGPSDLDYLGERIDQIEDQVRRLMGRAERIRHALVMLYMAFAAFVNTSLFLAISVWTQNKLRPVPTGFAVLGVVLLLGACINLVLEALEALRSNRAEVAFYLDLRARRRADAVPADGAPAGSAAR